jgi:hypothetical protein
MTEPILGDGFEGLVRAAQRGDFGPLPDTQRVTTAFTTSQAVRHDGRGTGYRNEVLSLRLGAAVGSCAAEPGTLTDAVIDDCVNSGLTRLLHHPLPVVQVAALDAFLMEARPHTPANGATPHPLPAGSSLSRSRARAQAVIELLVAELTGRGRDSADCRVLVVGVVNSLLEVARAHGMPYVPCDFKGGTTEWGDTVRTDALAELEDCDVVLASGMTLGNGTFEPLRRHALQHGKPLVMFAQTGSAVLPRLMGAGVTAVCAEPYPFFWLDGGPGVIHRYGSAV